MGPVLVIGGYLLGSCLPAVWIVKFRMGRAPWEFGDNPGGSGAWRLVGPVPGILTAAFDIAKGILPLAMARRIGLHGPWFVAAACSPVIGHNWPVFTWPRGGRGLSCATGALLCLAWRAMLPAYVLGVLVGLRVKWVPAVGVVAFPLGLLLMHVQGSDPQALLTAASIVLVVVARQVPWVIERFRSRRPDD